MAACVDCGEPVTRHTCSRCWDCYVRDSQAKAALRAPKGPSGEPLKVISSACPICGNSKHIKSVHCRVCGIRLRSENPAYRAKLSKSLLGHNPWNKGKKCGPMSAIEKEKISKALMGRRKVLTEAGRDRKVKAVKELWSRPGFREAMSLKCKITRPGDHVKNRPSVAGELNPRYIDGRTFKWRLARTATFKRDNYTCICCGATRGAYLNAHHILKRKLVRDIYDLNNLVTLCRECHLAITNFENAPGYIIYHEAFTHYVKQMEVSRECGV